MRVVIAVAAGLLLCLGLVVAYFVLNLDALAEDAIERYGSEATGTPVRVDAVDIDLRAGRGSVRGLEVGNPDGFDSPYALRWKQVAIDIDLESLRSEPYVLDAVVIDEPQVIFEINERGMANLRVIQQRLAAGDDDGEAPDPSAQPPRLRIRSFDFERGDLEARTQAVGGRDVRVELPSLELSDLGGAAGATAPELARKIVLSAIDQALRTVAKRELEQQVRKVIDEQLKGRLPEGAANVLDRLMGGATGGEAPPVDP